MKGGIKKTLS